ncbi:PKD domain-containing protein [Chitinophaga lutea]|nr:PKD domain-containing protein [Chitinophaga lutea]
MAARADHIIGGEMYYTYVRTDGSGNNVYNLTLKLFLRCDASDAQIDENVDISIYDAGGTYYNTFRFDRNNLQRFTANDVDPCIVNPPYVCYQIGYYAGQVTLPANSNGYIATFQRCCRRTGLANISSNRNDVGATYFTRIPGTNSGFQANNSPRFEAERGAIVCANNRFRYNFAAEDPDSDSLVYSFSTAYTGGTQGDPKPTRSQTPSVPVSYISPFTAAQPLGDKVTIDPHTGIISGIAPRSGLYIVTVSVREYRNQVLIGEHRKEFQFTVESCVRQVTAAMPDKYADCDGYTINFVNNSTPGKEYVWDFGDGSPLFVTTDLATFPHTYARQGTYQVKLVVDQQSSCGDSAYATVHVYPFLRPSFDVAGLCTTKPTDFRHTSTNDVGNFEYLKWDFGEAALQNDTSNQNNPRWQYTVPGDYTVKLLMRTDKGCERTISETFTIYDKPPFTTTRDTALCINDVLQLRAESLLPGSYQWGPLYNITGENTPTPTVSPKVDTEYQVTFTDATGCVNTKKVLIDVKDKLLVTAPNDSVICTGDPVDLKAVVDGPYAFTWTDVDTRQVVGAQQNVTITPARSSMYEILVTLGTCFNRDSVYYKLVDPPRADAGADATICHGETIWLEASGGSSYRWEPAATLTSPRRARTQAWPKDTTTYTVTVTDTLGCPKAVTADVTINVVPPVPAFAGNDTILIKGRPFQLNGTGGFRYEWSPADGLSSTNIPNPLTTIDRAFTYHLKVYTKEGCLGEDDINLRFMAGPEIYVPNAFSPNGDGLNDLFRPIPVGITRLDYFRVYNRWGQLVYNTQEYMKGWDGRGADNGTYVWVVGGLNDTGQMVEYKGTVVLIR